MIKTEKELFEFLESHDEYDAIVVEGYDGVGKGRILNILSEHYGVVPYRPDYNLWQKYDHRNIDRWKISGFFWDVYSHFNKGALHLPTPMLFDRGVLSGAVYGDNIEIARDYKKLLRDRRVLHILVTCDEYSYRRFAMVRGVYALDYEDYLGYTSKYKRALDESEADYLVIENNYDPILADDLAKTCEGCGHYSYGFCRHPSINRIVSKGSERCKLSNDKEVQDISDTEMQCM